MFIYWSFINGDDESDDCRGFWVSQKVFPICYYISVIFCLASSWVDDESDTKTNYKDTHFNHAMMVSNRPHNPHAVWGWIVWTGFSKIIVNKRRIYY